MKPGLSSRERCSNHLAREAVARCPECRRFLCRECATEHGGRVICSLCMRTLLEAKSARKKSGWPAAVLGVMAGLLAGWFFFYVVGQMLLSLPSRFHEETVWQSHWADEP